MKKILQVILHVLGIPLLLALAVLVNLPILKNGISYGFWPFIGVIVAVVIALVYLIGFLIVTKRKKKRKSIMRQTVTMVVLTFFCLTGLWCVIDIALPNILADATSSTIFYEDLVDNHAARADINKGLLDEYISRNYKNGNLPNDVSLKTYQKEGMRNKKIKEMFTIHFASIDIDGYKTFVDPWIGMANDSRLTIPTLVHLLTDVRKIPEKEYYLYDKKLDEIKKDPLMWNVLDMMGKPMGLDFDLGAYGTIINQFGGILGDVIGDPGVLGSPIVITYQGKTLTLTPSNEMRGVLDYQSMGWLNSNGVVYAITGLIALRTVFLMMSGWLIFTIFAIGLLRGAGKKEVVRPNRPMTQQGMAPRQMYGYSYVEVKSPYDFYNVNMGAVRQQLIQDSRANRPPNGRS